MVRPFSSDEHGGIIGSPLSAFDEFKKRDKKGRETSLLVSPVNNTAVTPSNVPMTQINHTSDSSNDDDGINNNENGLSGIKTSL